MRRRSGAGAQLLGRADLTILRRGIRRALKSRSAGAAPLRKQVAAIIAGLRVQGITDATARAQLAGVVLEVATASGNDRMDVVTGLPRWQFVMDLIDQAFDDAATLPTDPD